MPDPVGAGDAERAPAIPSPSEIAGSSHPSMLLLREGR
jgi:hypothetical protein